MPIKLNKSTLSILRRIACFLLFGVMGTLTMKAQVSTTVTMSASPISGSPFSSLAAAITAVNGLTITGPVVVTAAAGSETNPSGGYSITATGTSTNTITIQGASVGTTTITAPSPAGTAGNLNDAIFKIIGGDYITIKSFTMNENSANTTTTAASNNMVEWGVALLYTTTTNGAQNCTIQNNTITLNRTYQNTFGIYSNSTHSASAPSTSATATTTAGGNSGLKIYSNSISNVNNGIVVVGPTAAADANTGVEIGGSGFGNTISNFGTTGTFSTYANVSGTVNGILIRNSIGFVVSNNSITSSAGGVTVGTLNGIQVAAATNAPTATFTNNINSNTISLQSGLSTGAINGINYPSGSASATSILNINSNNFTQLNHSVAASGTIIGIVLASTNLTTSISNNTFTNLTTNTTGSFTFISQTYSAPANGSKTTNGNSIVTAFAKTGAGGTVIFITDNGSTPSTCTSLCQNNNFSNGTLTGATTLTGLNYTDGGTAPTRTVSGNTINNWTTGAAAINCMNFTYWQGASSLTNNTISNITGQGSITGITIGSAVNTGTTVSFANNTINNLSSTGTGGAVTGISCTNTSTQININNNTIRTLSSTGASAVSGVSIGGATSTSVYKNTICDISGSNASSTVNGILVSGGTTISVYNNRVADLRTPAANAANPLVGLNITGGTTVNAYYNTVYLNATSSGALFGSSALSASTSPTLTLNNNSFHNASTSNGTGLSVAYRRASTTLTTYGSTSDRNNFMATNLFYDGTTAITSLLTYKAFMTTRDQNAVSVIPPYLSTTCGAGNFLKMNLTTPTQIESGGAPITGITDDFEGDTRNASTPDIGADEFAGTPAPVCNGTPASSSISGSSSICTGFSTNLSLSTTYTDLGITYQWASSTVSGGPYTNLGTSVTQNSGVISSTTYYVCTITCSNSGLSFTTAEFAITVNANPIVSVTSSSAYYCSPGGSAVNLTASGGTTYSWSPSSGLSATTGTTVSSSPTSGTIYTVTGTDGNGCTASSVFTINVANAITNLTSSASPNPICSGNTLNLSSSASLTGLNNYVPTLSTGVSYSSIIPATTITSWRNGASTDDNLSDNQPIGFNFNYNGTPFNTFRVSTNGFITFDNASTAIGNGSTSPYSYTNNWTTTGNGLIVAPNWDDLQTAGNAGTITDLNNSINYVTSGSAGSRVLTVEWKNMQDYNTTSTASYNFQVKLYESDNHIEFVYGTMTQSATSVSYSLGLSAATVSTTPTASQLLSQTTSNTNAFGFSNQNSLTPVPTANTQVSFYPATLAYNWSGPSAYSSGSQNPSIANIATSASGVYTVTATSNVGCSATSSVAVTVNATTTGTTTATACDSYTWSGALGNGNTYTSSTSVSNVTTNAAGCPHTETLNLTVNYSTSGTTTATACDSYNWSGPLGNGVTYTSSTTVTNVTTNAAGCNHTETLNLTIKNSTSETTTATACDSYTWAGPLGNGVTYTSSTTVSNVTINAAGCNHTQTLNLIINNSTTGTTNATACDSYTWSGPLGNGVSYTSSTTVSNVTTNAAGCPHTETLNLTVNYSSSGTTTATACDSYTWSGPLGNGVTYTSSTTLTNVTTNATGCNHTETLNLTINNSTSGTTTATACDSYTWSGPLGNGVTYTSSTTVSNVTTNSVGCNHTETLNLTVNYSTSGTTTATACDSYTWSGPLGNGVSYTSSTTVSNVTTNAAGCNHTETLNLTVNYSTSGTTQVTACDSYTWSGALGNGVTYISSTTVSNVTMNVAGCNHTETLNLTINYSTTGTTTATACDSYIWSAPLGNGNTYTSSNNSATHITTNTAGCAHTQSLNLTVNYSTSGTTTATACDSYVWSGPLGNGVTYSSSNNTATNVTTNSAGCNHTQSLNLTVNYSTTGTTHVTVCDSYTWSGALGNGHIYTSSTTANNVTTNAAGCNHTETLNLTVNHSTSSSVNVTACDSYTWSCNGQTYTQSGTYTCIGTNAAGCTHTTTLNLTINYSTSSTTTVGGACGSYVWSVNGQTYTQSGTYTVMSTNASGCPHASILVLTVIPSVPTTVSQTQCGGTYTWPCTGLTYSQSGSYICGSGCYQVTMNLTINAIPVVTAQNVSGCPGTAITLVGSPSGGTYSLPNPYTGTIPTYTYYYTTPQGCTNSATATITLNTSLGNVTNLSISGITSTSANASWGGSGVWFDIRYKPTSSSIWTNGASGSSFSKLITGLTASTIYSVEVRGYCIQGSTPTNWVGTTFTTSSGAACATPVPTTTTNIAKTSCKLNWTHPGASYYNVRYKKTSVSTWTSVGTTTSISKLLSGLTANTAYEFQVQAVCTNTYTSAWSASGFFTTLASKLGEEDQVQELIADFNVYPNPAKDEVNILFPMDHSTQVILKVTDMSGRTVQTVHFDAVEGNNHVNISLGDLSNGVYSLQVIYDEKVIHTRRLVKN